MAAQDHTPNTLETRLEMRFAALQEHMDKRFADLDTKITAMSAQAHASITQTGMLNEVVLQQEKRYTEHTHQFESWTQRVSVLEQRWWKLIGAYTVIAILMTLASPILASLARQLLHMQS